VRILERIPPKSRDAEFTLARILEVVEKTVEPDGSSAAAINA